jgi:adenine phosphoribosyltransferase
MSDYLSLIQFNPQGPRNDIIPIFSDYEAFQALVGDLLKPFDRGGFDFVAGIDALGFILGAAAAISAGKGFAPIRKAGKLPRPFASVDFVDYTGKEKSLETGRWAIKAGAGFLLMDDWIETGAQMKAAVELVEFQGGVVAGICAVRMDDCQITRWLREHYRCHSVLIDP